MTNNKKPPSAPHPEGHATGPRRIDDRRPRRHTASLPPTPEALLDPETRLDRIAEILARGVSRLLVAEALKAPAPRPQLRLVVGGHGSKAAGSQPDQTDSGLDSSARTSVHTVAAHGMRRERNEHHDHGHEPDPADRGVEEAEDGGPAEEVPRGLRGGDEEQQ